MRVVWTVNKIERGVNLLDVSHYSLDEEAGQMLVHIRREEALPLPLDDPAAQCVRDWFAYHYQLEQQQLKDALADVTGGL